LPRQPAPNPIGLVPQRSQSTARTAIAGKTALRLRFGIRAVPAIGRSPGEFRFVLLQCGANTSPGTSADSTVEKASFSLSTKYIGTLSQNFSVFPKKVFPGNLGATHLLSTVYQEGRATTRAGEQKKIKKICAQEGNSAGIEQKKKDRQPMGVRSMGWRMMRGS
jgi:hypothetical protein